MKEYIARRLVDLGREFLDIRVAFYARDETDKNDVADINEAKRILVPWCNRVAEEAQFLGLPSTTRQAKRITDEFRDWKAVEVERELEQLQRRFNEEIEAIALFYIPSDGLQYYNKTALFGERFKVNFPLANSEITEAGNCLAFDRFTSCVFHLVRSLEIALKVVFQNLGLPPLSSAGARNWNGLLKQIKEKLDRDRSIADHSFYDAAYVFLAAAKNPMRNATMHVDVTYPDEGSVRPVWLGVESFMRHLATKLKE